MEFKKAPLPFMTAVAGHVLIHELVSGTPLPDDWAGICEDASDTNKHWYVGQYFTGRSFRPMKEHERLPMLIEAAGYKAVDAASFAHAAHMHELVDRISSQWDGCIHQSTDINIGDAIRATGTSFIHEVYPVALRAQPALDEDTISQDEVARPSAPVQRG